MWNPEENMAIFRFYGSLNDFLAPAYRQKNLTISFKNHQTLKDAIEAMGVPHPEVHMILVNGEPGSFTNPLINHSRISVFPFFHLLSGSADHPVNAHTHKTLHFILDVHLGKLSRYLRFAGFDTLLFPGMDDPEIVEESLKDQRIILTRDIGLLKHKKVKYGYWLRSQDPLEQFREVVHHFRISKEEITPWKRCSICNGTIVPVSKTSIEKELNPGTRRYFNQFYQCKNCGKIYWKGSHFDKLESWMKRTLESIPWNIESS